MRLAALCHTRNGWRTCRALGGGVFYVEVVGSKMEDRRSKLERPDVRVCDQLLGPPPSWARLVDHLDEAIRQLRVELATQREANVELEALQTLAV
jgi:hypothetical protein